MSALWDRLPGESASAYRAFRRYRDLSPAGRSVRAAAGVEAGARAPRHWERWSARWRWGERVDAWDDECYRRADAALLGISTTPAALEPAADVDYPWQPIIDDDVAGQLDDDPWERIGRQIAAG